MIRMFERAESFVSAAELEMQLPFVQAAHELIHSGRGAGSDFLGWLRLPQEYDHAELRRILETGKRIAETAEILVVIGIGGSYLGARAALSMLRHSFAELLPRDRSPLQVIFAGHQMSGTYLTDLLEVLDGREVAVNVISKSGTTTEPALAFRVLEAYMQKRYGKAEAAKRIVVTTDRSRGALRDLANAVGYETFVVPDDVGGRFSVLTPVGLFPLAAAGIDVEAMLSGAQVAQDDTARVDLGENHAYAYAALRHGLRQKGKLVELLVSYEPGLHYVGEWWKQLFGESEGKDHKGILPASADFSTDLHSLGQYIQEGRRFLFETALRVRTPRHSLVIEELPGDADGLNYLAGKTMQDVNDTALQATILAHVQGGVPNIGLELADMGPETLGYLFYFFEKACAISAYLQGVNPFDQPGVEAYKTNMFALLGKPGYEDLQSVLAKGR